MELWWKCAVLETILLQDLTGKYIKNIHTEWIWHRRKKYLSQVDWLWLPRVVFPWGCSLWGEGGLAVGLLLLVLLVVHLVPRARWRRLLAQAAAPLTQEGHAGGARHCPFLHFEAFTLVHCMIIATQTQRSFKPFHPTSTTVSASVVASTSRTDWTGTGRKGGKLQLRPIFLLRRGCWSPAVSWGRLPTHRPELPGFCWQCLSLSTIRSWQPHTSLTLPATRQDNCSQGAEKHSYMTDLSASDEIWVNRGEMLRAFSFVVKIMGCSDVRGVSLCYQCLWWTSGTSGQHKNRIIMKSARRQ